MAESTSRSQLTGCFEAMSDCGMIINSTEISSVYRDIFSTLSKDALAMWKYLGNTHTWVIFTDGLSTPSCHIPCISALSTIRLTGRTSCQ